MQIILSQAYPEQYQEISDMACQIWQDHYVPIIGQEQVNYMLQKMYDTHAIAQQVAEGQKFYIIQDGDNAMGYLAISAKETGVYMINKFYIKTSDQGKGIGEIVFKKLLPLMKDAKQITLTVNRQNYKSINFYFKIGFRIESVADFDIGNGYYMNDFVMVKQL